ncbi:MAG: hypothetical protein INH41_20075 [Myxococcaceae bacterium]|nr:hypothetical protein [Myxococcaceae bacterium]MCA3014686.1 hypothetical protein [Myxococcaceae bacterium]
MTTLAAPLGCARVMPAAPAPPEALYVAVHLERDGQLVAAPRLLGFEGRRLFAERRAPGAASPDYRLLLEPDDEGSGYGISLDLELPSGRAHGKVDLRHGEERTVSLDARTRLTLLVMRVDSPEFRALMRHRAPAPAATI